MGRKVKVKVVEDCPECDGLGEILTTIMLFGQPPSFGWTTCPECEGTGKVRSVYEVDEADLKVEEE